MKKIITNDKWVFFLQVRKIKPRPYCFLLVDILKYQPSLKIATIKKKTFFEEHDYSLKFKISNNFLLEENCSEDYEFSELIPQVLLSERIFFNIL